MVKAKGVDENRYAVDCLIRDVQWMGHTKLMLRSDNEKSIVALLRETLKSIRIDANAEQIAEEHPPEYDPRANGAIESTVGAFKGQLRTMVLALECRIGHRIPPEHPVIGWIVPHVAWTLTTRAKGEDGKTAYERVRLRPFTTRMIEFGECCRHKLNKNDLKDAGTLAARWSTGIFLGICTMTGRYLIWDGNTCVAARTVVRLPDVQKWDMTKIAAIAQRPWELHEKIEAPVIFREAAETAEAEKAEPMLRNVRKLYIKRADVEAYGYTQGCPKCGHDLQYAKNTRRAHEDTSWSC